LSNIAPVMLLNRQMVLMVRAWPSRLRRMRIRTAHVRRSRRICPSMQSRHAGYFGLMLRTAQRTLLSSNSTTGPPVTCPMNQCLFVCRVFAVSLQLVLQSKLHSMIWAHVKVLYKRNYDIRTLQCILLLCTLLRGEDRANT